MHQIHEYSFTHRKILQPSLPTLAGEVKTHNLMKIIIESSSPSDGLGYIVLGRMINICFLRRQHSKTPNLRTANVKY